MFIVDYWFIKKMETRVRMVKVSHFPPLDYTISNGFYTNGTHRSTGCRRIVVLVRKKHWILRGSSSHSALTRFARGEKMDYPQISFHSKASQWIGFLPLDSTSCCEGARLTIRGRTGMTSQVSEAVFPSSVQVTRFSPLFSRMNRYKWFQQC